ncbi:GrpB family protein [Chitinimonas sp.]|uniref:GrpB family protein n=1 Tax=Chitinimonas sp. TaxID=1934313 RepID=UPI0035B3F914
MTGNEVLIGGVEKAEIKIVDYDSLWEKKFELHKATISSALGTAALQIEHIGSTAVPGLAAKPIIDIVVVVENAANESTYLAKLIEVGYQLRVREPDFFEHRMVRTQQRDVHIHIFSKGCIEIERYLLLRNYLRSNPDRRAEYQKIKKELAAQDWPDMNAYSEAKTEIIERLIHEARQSSMEAR